MAESRAHDPRPRIVIADTENYLDTLIANPIVCTGTDGQCILLVDGSQASGSLNLGQSNTMRSRVAPAFVVASAPVPLTPIQQNLQTSVRAYVDNA